MAFLHPYFLIAVAGALLPYLIHRLTRDRIQHVAFSTLRFLAKGAKLVVHRRKASEALLLLLRAAILLLLALIFARPFLKPKNNEPAPTIATARVIVADTSASMLRPGVKDALLKEVLGAAGTLKSGEDAGALVTFSDAATLAEPLRTDFKVDPAMLAPGYGGTNIAAALRKANDLLRPVRAKKKEIVLISDLQREGWRYFKGDWKLAGDVQLRVVPIAAASSGGLAIVEAACPQSAILDKQASSLAVRIANYATEARNNVEVTLTVNGKKAETQRANIRPGGTVPVRFRYVFTTPGDNLGTIAVEGDAAQPGSTPYYFNVRAIPRIPVLLVSGRSPADAQDPGTFFLNKALAPSDEAPFDVKRVAASSLTAADAAQASVVILSNTRDLPAPFVQALGALLNRGGGLFLLPGAETSPDLFNASLGQVAPCKLRGILQARPSNGETAESLTHIDYEHPIFSIFANPHHGNLSLPKFGRYWETSDTQLSRILARFGDGRPAIAERQIGSGISIAFLSAIDPSWSDFVYKSVFLPYLHQTVRYLAIRTEHKTAFSSGDMLPIPTSGTLKNPRGEVLDSASPAAAEPGFYKALASQGKEEAVYAVNASLAEGNPATVAPDEIEAALERAPGELNADLADNGPDAAGKPDGWLWGYLLCGLLVLTMAELTVANKTLRH